MVLLRTLLCKAAALPPYCAVNRPQIIRKSHESEAFKGTVNPKSNIHIGCPDVSLLHLPAAVSFLKGS